ncbi:D-alanyl-D-alanine carboxypeptidase [Oikeobacillus pervagus]|uniref:D-alanyl-D-alanine carboxypeptidase n=1 Tax=Oikeobacillus pervagus TaxID=1325931 RepID=A0AAJ1SX55_9BACI|nr:M15 family metallopeptidase [Oikeobacillus pervagus]MDQ0214418.1 D-alanyl-D-alanine carboxypeptidase [Oikeobacillus pervagus]
MNKWFIASAIVFLLAGCQNADPQKTEDTVKKTVHQEKKTKTGPQLKAVFFNQIKEVNGKKIIANPENTLSLVNKHYFLPGEYTPTDLVRPNVRFSFGDQDIEKSYLRKQAAKALEEMFSNAKQQGVHLFAVSGYRSYDRQVAILNNEIARVGETKASQAVAPPGQSEHQTGLSMDISAESVKFNLTEDFENTTEGKWLAENAHQYGFILRYPKGKESLTGYKYEPWHFRYVGKQAAKEIYENKWTLEEYFNNVEKI